MEHHYSDEILYPGEVVAFPECGLFLCFVVSVAVIAAILIIVRLVLDKYWPKKDKVICKDDLCRRAKSLGWEFHLDRPDRSGSPSENYVMQHYSHWDEEGGTGGHCHFTLHVLGKNLQPALDLIEAEELRRKRLKEDDNDSGDSS